MKNIKKTRGWKRRKKKEKGKEIGKNSKEEADREIGNQVKNINQKKIERDPKRIKKGHIPPLLVLLTIQIPLMITENPENTKKDDNENFIKYIYKVIYLLYLYYILISF